MAADKLLHVSCIVRESHVWQLLRTLEAGKANNVEVRPVEPLLQSAEPGETPRRYGRKSKKTKRTNGKVGKKLGRALKLNQEVRLYELARKLKINPKSAMSAMTRLISQGVVKRTGMGLYTRIKPDGERS